MCHDDAPAERPLRADAERNRQRIIDAARELFAERGLDVTLNDIARHAGVGVGTVYRRFPDKEAADRRAVRGAPGRARGDRPRRPGDGRSVGGPRATLTGVLELQEADRGFKELMLSAAAVATGSRRSARGWRRSSPS